jgi:hypothetical protein
MGKSRNLAPQDFPRGKFPVRARRLLAHQLGAAPTHALVLGCAVAYPQMMFVCLPIPKPCTLSCSLLSST